VIGGVKPATSKALDTDATDLERERHGLANGNRKDFWKTYRVGLQAARKLCRIRSVWQLQFPKLLQLVIRAVSVQNPSYPCPTLLTLTLPFAVSAAICGSEPQPVA
jgi:hypothetical protein